MLREVQCISVLAGLPKSTHWPCTPAAQIQLLIPIPSFLTPKVFCRERGEREGEGKFFDPRRFITLKELKINE